MMKVLIVDDEKPARNRLQRLVNDIEGFHVVAVAQNGQQAIEMSEQYQPEIILMDIRMPGIDGIEAARLITEQELPPAIIYCTAYSDHALQAFEAHAVDYLLKPVVGQKLHDALHAATKTSKAQQAQSHDMVDSGRDNDAQVRRHICARVRGNLVLVPLSDIYFFHADQKYVTVRHQGGELLIEETLLSLENEFSGSFIRVHRNALVALSKIDGLSKNESSSFVTFKEIEEQIEISRRHLPSVRKIIKNL